KVPRRQRIVRDAMSAAMLVAAARHAAICRAEVQWHERILSSEQPTCSICHSINAAYRSQSTSPLLNGATSGVNSPFKNGTLRSLVLAVALPAGRLGPMCQPADSGWVARD